MREVIAIITLLGKFYRKNKGETVKTAGEDLKTELTNGVAAN